MAERRLKYALVWPLFLASTLGGAALLLSKRGGLQLLGILLLAAPLLVLGVLSLAYYVVERRKAA